MPQKQKWPAQQRFGVQSARHLLDPNCSTGTEMRFDLSAVPASRSGSAPGAFQTNVLAGLATALEIVALLHVYCDLLLIGHQPSICKGRRDIQAGAMLQRGKHRTCLMVRPYC